MQSLALCSGGEFNNLLGRAIFICIWSAEDAQVITDLTLTYVDKDRVCILSQVLATVGFDSNHICLFIYYMIIQTKVLHV